MLVLSRKPGEKVCIGPDITLTLIEVKGNRVRIGIEAPDQVSILRSELEDSRGAFVTEDKSPELALNASNSV